MICSPDASPRGCLWSGLRLPPSAGSVRSTASYGKSNIVPRRVAWVIQRRKSNSPNCGERFDLQEGEGQARADHDNGQAQADRGAAPVSKRAFHDVSPLVTPDGI